MPEKNLDKSIKSLTLNNQEFQIPDMSSGIRTSDHTERNTMMKSVVLFDIDGTIVTRTSHLPSSKQLAYTKAIEEVYGLGGINYMDYPIFGLTDRGILYLLLKSNGFTDEQISPGEGLFRERILSIHMNLANGREPQFEALPGAADLLGWLKTQGIRLGLATGNFETLAWFKLIEAGLEKYFLFGGFGEDGIGRDKIVEAAVAKAGSGAGRTVTLLGDTPNDLAAAEKANVDGFAVATGKFSPEELRKYAQNDDRVFTNLIDTATVGKRLLKMSG